MSHLTAACCTMLCCLLFWSSVAGATAVQTPAAAAPRTVTYAYFPLAVPVAVVAEIFKRDRILASNLAKQGITLQFQPLAKGKEVVDLLRQGTVDAFCVSDSPLLEASQAADLAVLGMVKQSYAAVVASTGTRMSELRQKRVGSVSGSTSHQALLQGMAAAGLTEKDLTLVMMEVNALPEALLQKKVDAIAAWEPTPTALLAQHPRRFSRIYQQASYSYYAVSRRLLEQQPEAARELSAALLRGVRWLKRDPANLTLASRWTVDSMTAFTGKPAILSPAEVARVTTMDLLDVPGLPLLRTGSIDTETLKRLFDFMHRQQQLPPQASWQALHAGFKPDYLRRIAAEPKRHQLQQFSYNTGTTP